MDNNLESSSKNTGLGNFDNAGTSLLEDRRRKLRHSAAHVLAEAVVELFPDALPAIGPPTADGFYYDFSVPKPFTPEDLGRIEKRMRDSVRANTPFVERKVSKEEGLKQVESNIFKVEILEGIPAHEQITLVSHSNGGFTDLCRGGHVEKTGDLSAFKLLKCAGAYWRGDETKPMLQRIYGTAWESRKSLEEHLHFLKEAGERDHRIVGRELGLFFFDTSSPAAPFFMPRGAIVVNKLVDYIRELYDKNGYQEVITPQVFNSDLWKISGHYDNYAQNMYFTEDDTMAVKPMNCPAAAMVFKAESHSYRELPLRLADFGRLHRNERSGVTHGLTRVRTFVQDDAHIFCTPQQIGPEVEKFLSMLEESYHTLGFENWNLALSTRPENRVGDDAIWDKAETVLKSVLEKIGAPFSTEDGEGAFYGPKIDIFVPDAIGRTWQLGTVQVDFSLPQRFNLEYTSENGTREHPVVIHRAMLGSIERFLGVLLEHTKGRLPLWLAPVQVTVIPIADRHIAYAERVASGLRNFGIRVENNIASARMNAKIRDARIRRIPYMLIIGDREEAAESVAVRSLSCDNLGVAPIDSVGPKMLDKILTRSQNFDW